MLCTQPPVQQCGSARGTFWFALCVQNSVDLATIVGSYVRLDPSSSFFAANFICAADFESLPPLNWGVNLGSQVIFSSMYTARMANNKQGY